MKTTDQHATQGGAPWRPWRPLFMALAILLLPSVLLADSFGPAWWRTRGVQADTPANDYAAINQGQLKKMARAAMEELNENIPGGAGATLQAMVASWETPTNQTNNYAAVNLGQLKNLAKPFYDRLIEFQYTAQYPWIGKEAQATNGAMANIGQVKKLFSFDLTVTGTNGLPDWWQQYYFGGMVTDPNAPAPCGILVNGQPITILQAYQQKIDPIAVLSTTGSSIGKVFAGRSYSLGIDASGNLWSWGTNGDGQLGTGSTTTCRTPVQTGSDVISAAAGSWHSAMVKPDGTVWTCGYNYYGQLGDGTNLDRSNFTEVSGTEKFTAVATGCFHTLALKSDGTVWAWGCNESGQLGIGNNTDSPIPIQVSGLDNVPIVAIAAQRFQDSDLNTSFALDQNGCVWAWGAGSNFWFSDDLSTPVCLDAVNDLIINEAGKIIAIAVGLSEAVALAEDGSVWTWEDGREPTRIAGLPGPAIAITAGLQHHMALLSDGTVYAWEADGYYNGSIMGQLGDGTTISHTVPAPVKDPYGSGTLSGITSISAGERHSLAYNRNGMFFGWGGNNSGQVGIAGTTGAICLPVAITQPTVAAPALPTNLQGVIQENELHLTWANNTAGEPGIRFLIQRSSDDGNTWEDIGWVPATETSFNDPKFFLKDFYQYRVLVERWSWRFGTSNPFVNNIDSHGSGIPDTWKIRNGYDLNGSFDFNQDFDRDGYPLLYEYTHNIDPNNPNLKPEADRIVDPSATSGSNIYATIQAAIDASAEYDIIQVTTGTYAENLTFPNHKILLISSSGAAFTKISGTASDSVLKVSSDCTIHGFTTTGGTTTGSGGGILIQGGSPRFSNCIIRNNHAASGAAIHTSGSLPVLLNCTVFQNTTSSSSGAAIAISTGTMTLTNTILWNPGTSPEISGTELTATYSIIRGGWPGDGNRNEDPLLTNDGHLLPNSPCIGRANATVAPLCDMDNDPRGIKKSDIGADEFGLPKWWQLQHFGHLGIDPNADNMGDGLSNFEKWQLGLNPNEYHFPEAATSQPLQIGITQPQGATLQPAP